MFRPKKIRRMMALLGLMSMITACGNNTDQPATPAADISGNDVSANTEVDIPADTAQEEKTFEGAFKDLLQESGLVITFCEEFDGSYSINANTPGYIVSRWGITEGSDTVEYIDLEGSSGAGDPGEYKLTGYTVSLVSASGTALFDGMTDEEIIGMYHENGTDDTESAITDYPWNGMDDVFRKWTNTEYGVIVEDLSPGAHNLSYTIVKNGCVITVMGDYEDKDALETLVGNICNLSITE